MSFDKFISSLASHGRPQLAVLVDPDKFNPELIVAADRHAVSAFLLGGTKLRKRNTSTIAASIRKLSRKPLILFPGDETQLTRHADGLLLPVIISGRNPDYLIGKHVLMAPVIRRLRLPFIPMGYMLVNGGKRSATQSITRTKPLDASALPQIVDTAIAGEQLGYKAIYLEAGSGASDVVSARVIRAVRRSVDLPLIVGGGIDSAAKAERAADAGADLVVVGNALEKNVFLLPQLSRVFH